MKKEFNMKKFWKDYSKMDADSKIKHIKFIAENIKTAVEIANDNNLSKNIRKLYLEKALAGYFDDIIEVIKNE